VYVFPCLSIRINVSACILPLAKSSAEVQISRSFATCPEGKVEFKCTSVTMCTLHLL
jgi:hypothetical protein